MVLNHRLSARENLSELYAEAKELKRKRERIVFAMEELKSKIARLEAEAEAEAALKPVVRVKSSRKREWFEAFRWMYSSSGLLVVGGRDARQNELLVGRHLEDGDLFFHANVHGAPAVVLKRGQSASEGDLLETAGFAAVFSSAWKAGHGVADVYCVKPDQVSKYSHGEYVAKGGFMIKGERKWFKGIALRLRLTVVGERVAVVPWSGEGVGVVPGGSRKSAVAEAVKKKLAFGSLDEVVSLLPQGDCELSR